MPAPVGNAVVIVQPAITAADAVIEINDVATEASKIDLFCTGGFLKKDRIF